MKFALLGSLQRVLESSFPDNRLPRWFAQIRGMTENAAIEVGSSSLDNDNKRARREVIRLAGGGGHMKRKPDILWILVLIFSLGVVTTGYTQGMWESNDSASSMPVSHSQLSEG